MGALMLTQQAMVATCAEEWRFIYDGRLVKEETKIGKVDEQVLKQQALPQAEKPGRRMITVNRSLKY